jgi:hypothetical protein
MTSSEHFGLNVIIIMVIKQRSSQNYDIKPSYLWLSFSKISICLSEFGVKCDHKRNKFAQISWYFKTAFTNPNALQFVFVLEADINV